jgi:hypothetical protein
LSNIGDNIFYPQEMIDSTNLELGISPIRNETVLSIFQQFKRTRASIQLCGQQSAQKRKMQSIQISKTLATMTKVVKTPTRLSISRSHSGDPAHSTPSFSLSSPRGLLQESPTGLSDRIQTPESELKYLFDVLGISSPSYLFSPNPEKKEAKRKECGRSPIVLCNADTDDFFEFLRNNLSDSSAIDQKLAVSNSPGKVLGNRPGVSRTPARAMPAQSPKQTRPKTPTRIPAPSPSRNTVIKHRSPIKTPRRVSINSVNNCSSQNGIISPSSRSTAVTSPSNIKRNSRSPVASSTPRMSPKLASRSSTAGLSPGTPPVSPSREVVPKSNSKAKTDTLNSPIRKTESLRRSPKVSPAPLSNGQNDWENPKKQKHLMTPREENFRPGVLHEIPNSPQSTPRKILDPVSGSRLNSEYQAKKSPKVSSKPTAPITPSSDNYSIDIENMPHIQNSQSSGVVISAADYISSCSKEKNRNNTESLKEESNQLRSLLDERRKQDDFFDTVMASCDDILSQLDAAVTKGPKKRVDNNSPVKF